MSAEIAHVLRATVAEHRSFVVMAIPRLAGKTTTKDAMLASAKWRVARLKGDGRALDAVIAKARGGYLVIPEISQATSIPGYIWGAPVRRAFAAIDERTALATALHAPGIEECFDIICKENGVPDELAAKLSLVVYLRSLGSDWQAPTGRRVAKVHEILGVKGGRPDARLLFRWDEATDRFITVAAPQRIGVK